VPSPSTSSDVTARWEDERIGFEKVTAEVIELVGKAGDFAIVTMEELLHVDEDGGTDGEDD
jgi:hypothetical protein